MLKMSPAEKKAAREVTIRSFLLIVPYVLTFAFLAIEPQRLFSEEAERSSLQTTLHQLSTLSSSSIFFLTLGIWLLVAPLRFGMVMGNRKAAALSRAVFVIGWALFAAAVVTTWASALF